jgi:hypothetical protein
MPKFRISGRALQRTLTQLMNPTVGLTLAITLFATTTAWSESKYQYLADTANAIYELESRSAELKPEQVAEIAARACKTLERLLADKQFTDDLYRMDKLRPKDAIYHRQLRQDLASFVDSFLRPEAELLKQAGLSDEAAKHILWSAAFFRDSLTEKPDPKRILDALDRLRIEICSAATTIATDQDDAKKRAQYQKQLKKWALGIGGVLLIGVDAAAEAPSAGLATASFTLGGAMVGGAVAE